MPPQNKRGVALNTVVTGYGRIIPPHSSSVSRAGFYDTNILMATFAPGKNKSFLSFPKGLFSRR